MNTQLRPRERATSTPLDKRVLRAIVVCVLRLLVLLMVVLLALPIALLPIGTSVPTLLWILFALVDVVGVVILFRFRWTLRAVGLAMAGSLVVLLLAAATSQWLASTPPITDTQGNPLPNSIASLEKVNLNGSEQWITIRGQDVTRPVLLYLGIGGPGAGGLAFRALFNPVESRLESNFVIVSWDEPGTGKSYNAVPINALTPQRFVEDAHALTELLRARFHQDKIYVYGVSWTSILGIWLVQRYPELYYAYIGNGQMVNTTENDLMGYQFALNYATTHDDLATVETLRRNGPPPYTGSGMALKYVAYLDVLNDYMGSPRYAVIVPLIPVFSQEYGLLDKVNHFRGLVESFVFVYPQLRDLDFVTQAAKLDVPVYFFAGRNDVNAMSSLVERYYAVLQAPHKELIWFENAGHGLNDASANQFVDVMVNRVLAQTQPDPG